MTRDRANEKFPSPMSRMRSVASNGTVGLGGGAFALPFGRALAVCFAFSTCSACAASCFFFNLVCCAESAAFNFPLPFAIFHKIGSVPESGCLERKVSVHMSRQSQTADTIVAERGSLYTRLHPSTARLHLLHHT